MRSSQQNLIVDVYQRKSRKNEKQLKVLRFLRQHLWSTQSILQEVMSLQSRQAAHKTLCQMQEEGLIRSYQYSALGGFVTLWGITQHGQAMSFNPDIEALINAYFEPSRISEQTIRHQLDLQALRVSAEKIGWNDWLDGDRLGALEKDVKRPDALVMDPEGNLIAVECERTFKTIKRYEQILLSYLKLLKAGKVNKVVWVLPSHDMAKRLKSIITGIKQLTVTGQKVAIDPIKHHVNLKFISYQEWPCK